MQQAAEGLGEGVARILSKSIFFSILLLMITIFWPRYNNPILCSGGVAQNQPLRLRPTKLGSYFVLQLVIHVTMLMMNVILLLDSLGGGCPCQ